MHNKKKQNHIYYFNSSWAKTYIRFYYHYYSNNFLVRYFKKILT